jgi:hypothetical protein
MSPRSPTGRSLLLTLAVCSTAFAGPAALAGQHVALCAEGLASLVVTVQDRETHVALADAALTAGWRTDQDYVVRMQTDSMGTALICAPPDVPVTLRVAFHSVRVGPYSATLAAARSTTRTIRLDMPGAYLRGNVLDQQTGAPIPGVALSLANTPLSATTTADGRFHFERVPVGDYELRVAHVGYRTVPSPLRVRNDDLDATIRLAPSAIPIDPVIVMAFSRRLDHVGFYDRERRGVGTFIGRTQIDAMNAQTSSDLLRRLPGINLVPQWPQRNAPRNDLSGRGRCRFSYIVDGARTLPDFEMDFVAPYAIEGIEIYRGLAEVPASFRAHVTRGGQGGPSCGVIAIWTRDSR